MAKFRRKPTEVEAFQWFQNGTENPRNAVRHGTVDEEVGWDAYYVTTIHGQKTTVKDGDWIITEPDGEHHYPCKPDIFEATYEPVVESLSEPGDHDY